MRRILFLLLPFLITVSYLPAFGKQEIVEIPVQNDEWFLCVTSFDVKSMPEEKLPMADAITRSLVDKLKIVDYRTRVSNEYAYYEGQAWAKARSAAAKALSAKIDERSILLFRGEANWKYKQNLKKVNAEIEKLKIDLETVEEDAPLINREPVFSLISNNLDMVFPNPPSPKGERRFCISQKADGMLTGLITDYHGRYFVSIKLYTVYTDSYAYEDSVIFSPEDMDKAMNEIAGRLIITLSGNRPALLAVKAEPAETLVLINRSFAGRGETEKTEYPPGKVTITASALNHETLTVETELVSGELTEVDLRLHPISFGSIEISGFPDGGSVYRGAMYMGHAPITLNVPLDTIEYIELETSTKELGQAVFLSSQTPDSQYYLSLHTSPPPKKGQVDKARRMHYWAWGGVWITGIASWITYQTYMSYDGAARSGTAPSYGDKFIDDYEQMYYYSMGATVALGVFIAYELFQMSRYLYISNKGSTPIVKPDRNGQEQN
ncbi:MAG: hypothetical protein LBH44_05970 [Treponema sp.]|nr:hypothetical protein [Treponema sp.]